jgi:sugar transferase (PEP-CTERM/EpsH1 system associated)
MRILWLQSGLLLPLDKGGKLRTWHLLRHLAHRHDITYLSFTEPGVTAAEREGMGAVSARLETVPRSDPPKRSFRFHLRAALHLADPLPYAVGRYRSRAYRRKLLTLLGTESFDLIVCDFLVPAVNLPRTLPCPTVLFAHNVESEIWRRHAETRRGSLTAVLYQTQYRRMLRFERRTLERFDGVLAVSDADRDTFAQLFPGSVGHPIHVVPTGVDTEFFLPSPSQPASRRLVFTGSMDWLPNEDAMVFFCREVLPLIRAAEPDVTLSIVGRAPTPEVRRLASDAAVHVTGDVDDVRPYVRDAALYVVPLRIGGGTRLKIFEAMAMGRAVVSTSIGAEGLPVVDGQHLALSDDPEHFAATVVDLLRDTERRVQLERAARALVVERFGWGDVAGALETALERFARMGPVGAAEARSNPVVTHSGLP